MFKKQKKEVVAVDIETKKPETIQARLVSDAGEEAGPPLELPNTINVSQLGLICNAILQNVSFFYSIREIVQLHFFE